LFLHLRAGNLQVYSSEYHYIDIEEFTVEKTVSAADANRTFSQLLQGVRKGRSYVVTSHGKPIARISPVEDAGIGTGAREILLDRLRKQSVTRAVRWTRDELYENA
jgi:prevent-host-death family protein